MKIVIKKGTWADFPMLLKLIQEEATLEGSLAGLKIL